MIDMILAVAWVSMQLNLHECFVALDARDDIHDINSPNFQRSSAQDLKSIIKNKSG